VINGIAANDFQRRVLEKLARLETKMDMIVGNGQPGRMKLAEDRLVALERNDLRRTVYDRLITAGISFAISAIIAWRDRLGLK
jgi:predicted nicotinamide N-methyase